MILYLFTWSNHFPISAFLCHRKSFRAPDMSGSPVSRGVVQGLRRPYLGRSQPHGANFLSLQVDIAKLNLFFPILAVYLGEFSTSAFDEIGAHFLLPRLELTDYSVVFGGLIGDDMFCFPPTLLSRCFFVYAVAPRRLLVEYWEPFRSRSALSPFWGVILTKSCATPVDSGTKIGTGISRVTRITERQYRYSKKA